MEQRQLTTDDLLFVAFNGRVFGVNRTNGAIVWRWKGGSSNFISLLPDGEILFVSCQGYTWALDPLYGTELWHQPFKSEGTGVPSLATMRGRSDDASAAAELQAQAARAAQAAAS